MSNVVNKLAKPSVFLFSEFLIIVLGVLVALAVDNWRTERDNSEIRRHLIESLLSDLREDREDYKEFVDYSNLRKAAAELIGRMAEKNADFTSGEYEQARDALTALGSTARLETVESTFREMSALGTGATIGDSELRLKVSYYYGLARDRSDINDMLMPGILRYRESLEELGISYVDGNQIDVDAVLSSSKTLAVIRELGHWATGAGTLAADLQAENEELISHLEALQSLH